MRFLDTSRIRTRFDERDAAKDGTELSVDLYLPPQPGSYPAIVTRVASDNNRTARAQGGIALAPAPADRWKRLAAQGYIVAAADVRGRGDSDGKFVPFVHEAADGADTVAWARGLDECSGRVGVFGRGYSAFCAWAAAANGGVDAIVSVSPFGAAGEGLVHLGGAVRLDWLFWMHLVGGRTLQPANVPPWPSIHEHLPLATMDEALGRADIWWREWLERALDGIDVPAAGVPALHVTGWWDGQLRAARRYYDAAVRTGAGQRLIIGPWDTSGVRHPQPEAGGFDFGPRSVLDIDEETSSFFDEHLREGPRAGSTARLFVTGRNEWVDFDRWPTGGGEWTLHVSSVRGSNTRRGDGRLSQRRGDRSDVITDNPDWPVQFQANFVSFARGASPLSLDQAHITGRDEALVYTADAVDSTVTLLGRAAVSLSVRTDAVDGDVFVLLSDVFPFDERDLHLAHGAVRLATVPGFVPGDVCRVTVELDDVAHDLMPGHALRLTITPSLFPLYARNLHDDDYLYGTQPHVVDIEILHDGTSLTVPIA